MVDSGNIGQANITHNGEELVAIGAIRRPVGLAGEVRVAALGETLEALPLPSAVVLLEEQTGRTRTAVLAGRRQTPQGFLCRFHEVNSIEDANALRNWTVAIGLSLLPKLSANRYYQFELQGMLVVGRSGASIGSVVAVHTYPTTDAIEIRDGANRSIIIPLKGGAVVSIDTARRIMTVDVEALEELL